ncbi:hypothetical protein [Chryseolinea sp. H1M3-3]|uniref:hypothetical protein n=1 Tax=Chryseolinea sp. H1M3-3 TaxID=3034144 RepID=UPI0023EBEC43|nr:hypothetical protein [Chryseolinea sp. H1M3-3]
MKSIFALNLLLLVFAYSTISAQELTASSSNHSYIPSSDVSVLAKKNQRIVRITGARFAYPLVQKWIDDFNKQYPDIQVIIESRASSDPTQYEVLIEAYEHTEEIKKDREYAYVARYAVLPVANSNSGLARTYADKGLDKDLIVQLFFHDIYADKEKQKEIKEPFTVYTRLQKAGVPVTFSNYFSYEQKDVKGKAIAGSDEHILKALLRDSTGLSYLPLSLIYNHETKKPVEGITVLPVDLNGNGKVSDEEKFYDELPVVTKRFEETSSKDLNNVPLAYLHFSIDKNSANSDAITFVKWVINNGQKDLNDFGYIRPDAQKLAKDKFELFASKRIN